MESTYLNAASKVSLTTTPVALERPLLVTVIVKLMTSPTNAAVTLDVLIIVRLTCGFDVTFVVFDVTSVVFSLQLT